MPIQTTYGFTNDGLLPGMVSALTYSESVTGYADAAIEFGLGLVYDNAMGSDGRYKCKVPNNNTDVTFLGVAEFDHTRPVTGDPVSLTTLTTTQGGNYAIGDPIRIVKKGRVRVYAEVAVNPLTPVYVRHTANGGVTARGQFTGNSDPTRCTDISAVAKYAGVTTGAGYVDIDLDVI